MSDDESEPTVEIQFGTERIAQVLHTDLAAALKAEPLSYDLVLRCLNKAMLIGVSEAALRRRTRAGDKPH